MTTFYSTGRCGIGSAARELVRAAEEKPEFIDAYNVHVWRVYGFLAYRVTSRWEAEDLTQQTFERAYRAWRTFDPKKASVSTWLLAIAKNVLIDQARRRKSRPSESSAFDDKLDNEPAQEPAYKLGVSPELMAALATLTERDRLVIALRFGGDQAASEIASILDLSVANVQQIISRSLAKLRTELGAANSASASGS